MMQIAGTPPAVEMFKLGRRALPLTLLMLAGCMHRDVAIGPGDEHRQLSLMAVDGVIRQQPSRNWVSAAQKTRFQHEYPELCTEEGEEIACLASASFRSGYLRLDEFHEYRGFASVSGDARCIVDDGDDELGGLDDEVSVQVHMKNRQAVRLDLPVTDLRNSSPSIKAAAMLDLCRAAVASVERQGAG